MSHNQSGFTLIQAIFALVVLSLLGIAMMRLIGSQSATSAMAVQQARAYQAARSGLEWGAARVAAVPPADCNGSFPVDSFNVTVGCSSESFTEGTSGTYTVYRINSEAVYGAFGSPDHVVRRVQMKVAIY